MRNVRNDDICGGFDTFLFNGNPISTFRRENETILKQWHEIRTVKLVYKKVLLTKAP